jgi:hypothetical protein
MQNPFETVHRLAAQHRQKHEEALLPLTAQRSRIEELQGALRDLLGAGDKLKLSQASSLWHQAALAAEAVLNSG